MNLRSRLPYSLALTAALVACSTPTTVWVSATPQRPAVTSVPPSAGLFPDAPSRYYILQNDLRWEIGNTGVFLTVPAGFVTDLASVPRAFWSLALSPSEKYTRAAIIHDWLYWSQICTQPQADNLLSIAMQESEVSTAQMYAISTGVAIGGDAAWRSNMQELHDGFSRLMPPSWRQFPAGIAWNQQREAMRIKGLRDPVFKKNEPYCAYGDSQEVPHDLNRPPSTKKAFTAEGDLIEVSAK